VMRYMVGTVTLSITVLAVGLSVVMSAARRIDSMRVPILLLAAAVCAAAQPFSVDVKKVDGTTQKFELELQEGTHYFEVSLQDKRGFDFGECEVKDNAVCMFKHGSVMRFYKLSGQSDGKKR